MNDNTLTADTLTANSAAFDRRGRLIAICMICGFSIPILTICAFIVLQIFLALLHILFWWLPFVRICIPFPMIQEEE